MHKDADKHRCSKGHTNVREVIQTLFERSYKLPHQLSCLVFSRKFCSYFHKTRTCDLETAKNHDFFEAKKWHDLPGVWLNYGDGCGHDLPVGVWCSECHAVMICLYRARIIQA